MVVSTSFVQYSPTDPSLFKMLDAFNSTTSWNPTTKMSGLNPSSGNNHSVRFLLSLAPAKLNVPVKIVISLWDVNLDS